MIREINIRWIKWIDWVDLDKNEIYKVIKNYDFHELDKEASLEENQRARIDSYEDYLFMIFHFPKYNANTKIYELNEFNIFLWRDFIITFRNFPWSHIDKIFNKYSKLDISDDTWLKISSGFILYEIIQAMLEKMFKVTSNIKKDLKKIENKVFIKPSSSLVKDIMIKKRNIIVLKHMFSPQVSVMKFLEFNINKLYKWVMEVYFEDLEDKLEHIVNDIHILEEYIESIEDAFKTIIDIRTNAVIKILTIFSAFLLPLTFITSFYWMNINLPFQNNSYFVFGIMIITLIWMVLVYLYLKKSNKF